MAAPTIHCSIEPLVHRKVVYLPVAPTRKGQPVTGMVSFRLQVTNEHPAPAPGKPMPTLQLTSLGVSFPGSPVPAVAYARAEQIPPSKTVTLYLDAERDATDEVREAIQIPVPAPAAMEVTLTFKGFDEAWKGTWRLAPHASPTPEGSYGFPFRADDLPPGVLIEPNARHAAGEQAFAYDIHAARFDDQAQKWRSTTGDGTTNESHLVYGIPVRAVADGVVLKAVDAWEDNARPGDRKLLRGSGIEHGVAGVVSIAGNGADARIFTAVTDAKKQLQLRAFRPSADGMSLSFEGESAAGLPYGGTEISLASLSSTHAVTAAASGGAMLMSSWQSSPDGKSLATSDALVVPKTQAVKVERLSSKRLVMARQPVSGNLTVSVWDVAEPGALPPGATQTATASDPSTLFDVAVLSATRFVTASRTPSGTLRVTGWDLTLDGDGDVTKVSQGTQLDLADTVNQISVAATSEKNQFAVATRNGGGKLGLYFFDVADGGGITLTASRTGDAVTLVSLILFKRSGMATAVRTADGKLRFTAWALKGGSIVQGGQLDDAVGDVTGLALARLGEGRAGAAVRTKSGKLQVLVWRATEGNGYSILHGNEVVVYAHLQHKSLPTPLPQPGDTVTKGQVLGKVGNSGPSDGPHLHLHTTRVNEDVSDVAKVIERYAAGKLATAFRPMPFHGVQATLTKHVMDGDNNWFSKVDGQGFYFEPYAIHPGPQQGGAGLPGDKKS